MLLKQRFSRATAGVVSSPRDGWPRTGLHRWTLAGMASHSVTKKGSRGIQVCLVSCAHHGGAAPVRRTASQPTTTPRLSPPPPPSAPPLENCYRQTTIRQAPRNTCKTICEQRHRLARSVAASFAPLCLRPFPEEDSFVFRGACSNNSNMKVNCCSPG